MWLVSVTKSQVWLGSRFVNFGVITLTLSHTGHWKFNLAPHGEELSEDLTKRIVAPHKDGLSLRSLPTPQNWAAARWPIPYSGLTGQVPLRTGLAMVDQRSWVHVVNVISSGCLWEIDVRVLPALLQRLKGWGGQPVSARTIHHTLHQIGLHGCSPRRKPLLKVMHKKVPQTVCWRQANSGHGLLEPCPVVWWDQGKRIWFR